MCVPEVGLGVIPDAGGVFRLTRRLPRSIAMELLLTGRSMGAEEATRWGLANSVVPSVRLMDETRRLAEQIARAAPLASAALKEVTGAPEHLGIEEAYSVLRSGKLSTYQQMLNSEDVQEGPRAFAEKRRPVWRGE